jgi:hypothetical protein
MRALISGVSLSSSASAPSLACSWSMRDAPMITLLTRGLLATQARASCASVPPSSSAMGANCATAAFFFSSVKPSRREAMVCIAPRLPAGAPLPYLPVSRPEASGLQVVRPRPMSLYRRAYSCSKRRRWNRWYCGCSTTGLCQPWRSARASEAVGLWVGPALGLETGSV